MQKLCFNYNQSTSELLEALATMRAKKQSRSSRRIQLRLIEDENKVEMFVNGGPVPLNFTFRNDTEHQQLFITVQSTIPVWLLVAPIFLFVAPTLRGSSGGLFSSVSSFLTAIFSLAGGALLIYALQKLSIQLTLNRVRKSLHR